MKSIPLLEVADNVTQAPDYYDGTREYYATADVDGSEFLQGTSITFESRPSRANLVGKPGDLLFAKMKATDKVVHLNEESAGAIFSTGFFNLRPRSAYLDSRYLYWFLRSPTFQNRKDRNCTGATQKALTLAGLREIEIPLPETIDEQRRYAALLDKADCIRRKRQQVLTLSDEALKSAFLAKFGNPLTNNKKLPTAPIRELGSVVTGNTPSRKNPENFGDSIEWIKSDNINTPDHYLTPAEEYLSVTGRSIGRTAPAGSTLVTCIAGSPSVIGNAALANREVAFNQQINAVIPNQETDPHFLYCQFLVGKPLIQENSTNSMKGMVSKGKFQEIHFLKPDRKLQEDFGAFFNYALKCRENIQTDCDASHKLFGSLAVRAIRGEL